MSDTALEPTDGGDEDTEDAPEYRVSHLMEDVADTFSDTVQDIAPLDRGGIKPRVQNRVTFSVTTGEDGGVDPRAVEERLDTTGFAWTTDGPGEYVVLGRVIADVRELREGDRIHINKRRGPFKVYRVLEQPNGPEVLQRSTRSITAELTNVDTGTDWMLVQWADDGRPWAYVKTTDKSAKGGHRHRKVEQAERLGRIGPRRLFAPPADRTEDVEDGVPDHLETVRGNALAEARAVHPSDVDRVEHLFQKPVADAFSTEDANHVRAVLTDLSEWYERQANGLEIESDEDRERAAKHQTLAESCADLASAFSVIQMDAVDASEDTDLWVCADCGKAFLNRFKYPTHRRECGQADEQTDGNASQS